MYARFEDLKIWQAAREFRNDIYLISEGFPKKEQYALAMQIRRAAVSVTANIAEGHGRFHYQEEIQFLRMARGSINEILDHLYTALDQKYIKQSNFDALYAKGRGLEKGVNIYIGALNTRKKQGAS